METQIKENKVKTKDTICMMYTIVSSDGMGNSTFSDNRSYFLKMIKDSLIELHSEKDFRVKYLKLCIMKEETHEFTSQDKDQLRYILHAEYEPEDPHETQLEELRQRMVKGGFNYKPKRRT